MNKISIQRIAYWSLGAAVLLQFIMPFVYPVAGHDAAVHLNWLEQFPKLFREGNLYPRWMPDSFWGFGSPAFYFYPPFTYWCASLISFIFPSPVAIYQVLGLIATIASVGTCYLYLRSLVENKKPALIGALVYGVFPYRLLDLYLRNAIGEHLAFVILPLIMLSIEMSLRSNERKNLLKAIILSAIGWGGLFLTNIPTAIIAMYSVPIYSWMRTREKKQYGKFFFPLIGAIIGLMIAAVYLLPISGYLSQVKLSHLWDLQDSAGNTGFAMLDILHGSYRYFYIGILITLLIGGWLFYKFYRYKKSQSESSIITAFFAFVLIAVIVQIPYLFQPLWDILPGLKYIQFSYRWDVLIVLASAVYVALHFAEGQEKGKQCLITTSALVTIVIAFGYFFTMGGFQWHYNPVSGHIDAPEYIVSGASNNFEIAKSAFKEHAPDPLVLSPVDSVHIRNIKSDATGLYFEVEGAHEKLPLLIHRMYFPVLVRASLNTGDQHGDDELTDDSLGRIKFILAPNKSGAFEWHSLAMRKSNAESNGEMISIMGLLILGGLYITIISSRNPKAS